MSDSWYPRFPGDYGRDTPHLSLSEHGSYTLLLDYCYATGKPLPRERADAYRICRASSNVERRAVDSVLEQFFDLREDGWHNKRADYEIRKRTEFHDKLAAAGRKRWKQGGSLPGSVPGSSQASCQAGTQAASPAIASPQPQPQKTENKETRRQEAAPGDLRFQPFFVFALESFTVKHGRKPLWQGKDRNGLKNLLRNQSVEGLPLERLQTLWRNFLDSSEPFTVKQGGSLGYFCGNVDKFSDGPILAVLGKGTKNEKPSGSELAMRNARALGLDRPIN